MWNVQESEHDEVHSADKTICNNNDAHFFVSNALDVIWRTAEDGFVTDAIVCSYRYCGI